MKRTPASPWDLGHLIDAAKIGWALAGWSEVGAGGGVVELEVSCAMILERKPKEQNPDA
jgi:hypothetical protein